MSQETVKLIQRLVAEWNSHDPERVAARYTPDCYGLDVAIAKPQIGREGVKQMFAAYYAAFPDLKIIADDIIVEEERVAMFWTAHATHQGTILNIPASGRHITVSGVNRFVLQDELISHSLTIWDVAGMLRGMGLLPDL